MVTEVSALLLRNLYHTSYYLLYTRRGKFNGEQFGDHECGKSSMIQTETIQIVIYNCYLLAESTFAKH